MLESFSERLAQSVSDFSVYLRGKEYFEDGTVKKIWNDGNEYKARVQGSREYQVSIEFNGEKISTFCDCPFEGERSCKHVVAAILAFSENPDFERSGSVVFDKTGSDGRKHEVEELLSRLTESDLRTFLSNELGRNGQLLEDLRIYTHRLNESPVTLSDYKNRLKRELDKLDLNDLLTAWYQSGDDVYENDYCGDAVYDDQTLSDIVDNFVADAKKNLEFGNYAEGLKIYQAAFEALAEKRRRLKKDMIDLSDWFLDEETKCFDGFINSFPEGTHEELKRAGIKYLCRLLESNGEEASELNFLEGLKKIIKNAEDARFALIYLEALRSKSALARLESAVLAFLYRIAGEVNEFEETSLSSLEKYPELVLDLVGHYKKEGRQSDAVDVAEKVLSRLPRQSAYFSSFSVGEETCHGLGLEIRFALKDLLKEFPYEKMIVNLREIFFTTRKVGDYKELVSSLKTPEEKRKLLSDTTDKFSKDQEIRDLFKIFRFENRKREILELVEKYPEEGCFLEMIRFIQNDFPKESFLAYENKIKKMLEVSKAKDYREIIFHLKNMHSLGLEQEFKGLIVWIKGTYHRKRNLMQDLKKLEAEL